MTEEKYYTIGAAGKTIDGREIDKNWFKSIVRDYNTDLKTASINDRHWSDGVSLGTVLSVKQGVNSLGMDILQAKIKVNKNFEHYVNEGWAGWFSMEIDPVFSYTSEAYLVGLAVTNNPASLGNPVIELNSKGSNHFFSNFFESEEISQQDFEGKDADHEGLDVSLFESFKNWIAFSKKETKQEIKEEDMPTEQYESLFNEIKSLRNELKPKEEKQDYSAHNAEAVKEILAYVKDVKSNTVSKEDFESLKSNTVSKEDFDKLKANFEALKSKPQVQPFTLIQDPKTENGVIY